MTRDIDIPEFKFNLFILFPYLLLEMMQYYGWSDDERDAFMVPYHEWARIRYAQWEKSNSRDTLTGVRLFM